MSAVQSSSVWSVVKSVIGAKHVAPDDDIRQPMQLWYDAAKWYQPVLQRQEGVNINCINVYKNTHKKQFLLIREKKENE